jgi:hypothetical protein
MGRPSDRRDALANTDPDALQGSRRRIAAWTLVAARLTGVANMRGWAVAAHMSGDGLARADHRNGERFRPR